MEGWRSFGTCSARYGKLWNDGKANIITIAWTGIVNTIPPKTYISIRPERYSYDIIKNSGEFVINLTTKSLVKKADYCGVKTGAKCDKF